MSFTHQKLSYIDCERIQAIQNDQHNKEEETQIVDTTYFKIY